MATSSVGPVKSLEFYYDDGNIVFQVSNVLYRVHKSILTSRLELFGGMFQLDNCQQLNEGNDDLHPVQLENGVTIREDFEALLKHIYGPWDAPPYPVPFLLSVLKMSTKWGLLDGRERAIYYLEQAGPNFPSLLKFHSAIKYDVPKWIHPTFNILVSSDWTLGHLPTLASYDLCPDLIDLIVKTRDIIAREQRRLATIPPPAEHHPKCQPRQQEQCELAWAAVWILNIGRQIIHVDPLFRLEPYSAADALRALDAPGMSGGCLELTVEKVLEQDGFDYIHKVCKAALGRLNLQ